MLRFLSLFLCAVLAGLAPRALGQVPQVLSYQGRVAVDGVNFDSATAGQPGRFRFALVNGDGTETYWSNDGTSVAGSEPTAAVSLAVAKGLYTVLLGDTAPPLGMAPIPPAALAHPEVRLRVWFDDGVHGSQLLAPDQRLAAVAYAIMAAEVPDGAITGPKLALEAVGSAHLALGAVGPAQLAPGAVQTLHLAAGAVDNSRLATPSLTVATGAGLAGGGPIALGGGITIENTGVTALAGGGGITVSGSAGSVILGSNATPLSLPETLVWRDAEGHFAASTATLRGGRIVHTGTAAAHKPELVFDRGIGPKGRLTFQRSGTDTAWSGLVLSVNADWHADGTGYVYDDPARSQSVWQMEYEWSELGYPVNEINWTTAGRRLWYSWGRADDPTQASVQWFAPTLVSVPALDTTIAPIFGVEGYKGAGDAVQIVLQNSNTADAAAATQIVLRSAGTSIVHWSLGTDRFTTGADNFYIQQSSTPRLFITPAGDVGIGSTAPAARLDVAGIVNAKGFTVGGAPFVAKPSESFFAADLPTYNNAPKLTPNYKSTRHLLCADAAQSPAVQAYLNPSRWAGRRVKVGAVLAVDGASGGDLYWQGAVIYRNTPLDGTSTVGLNAGDGDGTAWAGSYETTAAPTVAHAYKAIETGEFIIPANATGLVLVFSMVRTNAADTNTDSAYVLEVRLTEQ
jgi:hypothetical protein